MNKEDKIKELERELEDNDIKRDILEYKRVDLMKQLNEVNADISIINDSSDVITKQINKLTGEIMNESRGSK